MIRHKVENVEISIEFRNFEIPRELAIWRQNAVLTGRDSAVDLAQTGFLAVEMPGEKSWQIPARTVHTEGEKAPQTFSHHINAGLPASFATRHVAVSDEPTLHAQSSRASCVQKHKPLMWIALKSHEQPKHQPD